MILPIKRICFDKTLKKTYKTPQFECIPSDLAQETGTVGLQYATLGEVQNSFSYIQPLCAVLSENGNWIYSENECRVGGTQLLLASENFIEGNRYIESDEGIFAKKSNDEKIMISNARLRVIGIREEWESEKKSKQFLFCEINCNAWNGIAKQIEVPVKQYKQIYRLIRQTYPDVSLSTSGQDAIEDYLTEVFQNRAEMLPREIYTRKSGWMSIGEKVHYYIGRDPFYATCKLPDVSRIDKLHAFREGCSFLDVGKKNMAISIVMLVAHIGYSLYWFRKGQMNFRSVLFLQGSTNMLKTSVVREVSNVFDTDRDHAVIRIASTLASLQHSICMLSDQVVCLDDFSNSETKSKNKSVEAAEDAIRAVGDGVFPNKMNVKDTGCVTQNMVRAALILTGEENLGLGLSSDLRTIVVHVTEGTFNGSTLARFQRQPDVLRRYFALYIEFLTNKGDYLASGCQSSFPQYRQEYSKLLKVPRFIDTAAGLRVQVDFLVEFAAYCGVAEEEIQNLETLLKQRILEIMKQNQQASGGKKPEVRFVYAIMQSLGTDSNNSLARDEEQYASNESRYIGFFEKETKLMWFRWEAVWGLVKTYYHIQGEEWLVRPNSIKQLLLKNGISDGKRMPEGKSGNEYLRRAKKGARKRMLVLQQIVVEKLMEVEEDF